MCGKWFLQIPSTNKKLIIWRDNNKMQNFSIKNIKLILTPDFGEKINGKSNFNRRSPPGRGKGCSYQKQSIGGI